MQLSWSAGQLGMRMEGVWTSLRRPAQHREHHCIGGALRLLDAHTAIGAGAKAPHVGALQVQPFFHSELLPVNARLLS